jgi:hypothetical protein
MVCLLDSVEVSEIVRVHGGADESDTLHGVLSLATVGAVLNDRPVAVLLDGLTHIAESRGRVLDTELGSHLLGGDAKTGGEVGDDLTLRGVVVAHVATFHNKCSVLKFASTIHCEIASST